MFDDNQPVYLRPNVLFEPLSNRWYVSCYLLSPPAAALTVADRHAKIMQSFVASPRTHMRALENPAMAGGPFIRYGEERAPEIRDLLERTKADQAELFAFTAAIRKAEQMLLSEAQGHSLTPLYARLPGPLRGRDDVLRLGAGSPELTERPCAARPVSRAEDPLTCVVYGSGKALDELD